MSFSVRCVVTVSVLLYHGLTFSQVVLNEVMFDSDGSEHTDEFVEILNCATESVVLAGWRIGDGSGEDCIVDAGEGLILLPGQYGVILDSDYFMNSASYDPLIPEEALVLTIEGSTFGRGGFSNSRAETVVLSDTGGRIVAHYTYSPGNPSGHSDEKIDPMLSDVPENWADSRILLGTPGFRNSVTKLRSDLRVSRVWTKPDRPRDGEEVVLWVSIVNSGTDPASGLIVDFFEDVDGDSTLDEEERIGSVTDDDSFLMSGDSIEISVLWIRPEPGIKTVGIWVDYSEEERPEDNLFLTELSIGFACGTLVINEIMFDPLLDQPEWVELFNPQENEVDLRAWKISDEDTSEAITITDVRSVVPPSGYVVVSADSSILNAFMPWDGLFFVPDKFPNLNNDLDTVILFDPGGSVIDRVEYRGRGGGVDGFSIERINPLISSSDGSNWSWCVSMEGATPGRENSVYCRFLPSEAILSVSPNPFSPDQDGFEDVTMISYKLPMETSRVNLLIYDVRGRHIRTLLGASQSGSQGSIIWDGKNNDGWLARIGIYIVCIEGLNSAAGVVVSAKTTVVLASKL